LLYSRNHSPLAFAVYALIDVLSGPGRPVESRVDWIAGRLGASVGGVKKALSALYAHHAGGPLDPEIAPLITSRTRGMGLTAERGVTAHIPFVDLPEWVIGDDTDGPLVEHLALRLYAIIMHKRAPRRAWCALKRKDLAQMLRVRPDSIPDLMRQLEEAGMVVCVDRPGTTTIYLPLLTRETEGTVHAEIADAVRIACTQPVDKPIAPLASDDAPHASTGPTLHASAGSSPHHFTGSANKGSDLGGRDLVDPRGTAPAPCGAGGPPEGADVVQLVSERQRREQIVDTFTRAAETRAAAREAAAAVAARAAATRTNPTGGLAALIAAVEELESRRQPERCTA